MNRIKQSFVCHFSKFWQPLKAAILLLQIFLFVWISQFWLLNISESLYKMIFSFKLHQPLLRICCDTKIHVSVDIFILTYIYVQEDLMFNGFILNIHLSVALIFIEKYKTHIKKTKLGFLFESCPLTRAVGLDKECSHFLCEIQTRPPVQPAFFSTNLDISARRPHLLRGHGFSVSDSRHRDEEKHRRLLHVTLVFLHHKNKKPCRQK